MQEIWRMLFENNKLKEIPFFIIKKAIIMALNNPFNINPIKKLN